MWQWSHQCPCSLSVHLNLEVAFDDLWPAHTVSYGTNPSCASLCRAHRGFLQQVLSAPEAREQWQRSETQEGKTDWVKKKQLKKDGDLQNKTEDNHHTQERKITKSLMGKEKQMLHFPSPSSCLPLQVLCTSWIKIKRAKNKQCESVLNSEGREAFSAH